MKTITGITAGLVLLVCIATDIWWRQRERNRMDAQHVAALKAQVPSLQSEHARPRIEDRPGVVAEHAPSAAPSNVPLNDPNSATPAAAQLAPNAAMLQDPETRALMRKQQEQALAKLADKIITKDFAHDWNLDAAQTAQVKELVREKAAAGKDMLNAMLFDGLDDAALAQRGRETKQRLTDADAVLRAVLGADGFDALKQQERMLEIRERTKRIREELAATEQPLTEPQQDSLIEAMSSERQAFSFRVDYEDPAKFDFEHIREGFSEANLQIYFEDLQQLNARVVERAVLFLSPAQLEQLKGLQQSQIEQARLTARMTTELFNKRRTN